MKAKWKGKATEELINYQILKITAFTPPKRKKFKKNIFDNSDISSQFGGAPPRHQNACKNYLLAAQLTSTEQ